MYCICVFEYLYLCIFKKKAEVSVAVYSLGPGLPRMTSLLSPLHLFGQIASNIYFNHCPLHLFGQVASNVYFNHCPPSSFWADCLKCIFQPWPPFIFFGKLPQNMFQQQNYFPHFPSHTSPPPRSNNILLTDLSVSLEYFSQSFESRRLWCSLFAVQVQPGIFPLKYLNLPPLRLFGVHIFCFSEVCGIRQRRRFCQEFATGVQQAGVRVMENSPEHKQVKFAKFYFVHPVQLVEASEAGGDQDSTFISEHLFCFAFGDIYRKCYRQVKKSRCLDFRGLLRDLCVSGISFMIWEIISDSQFHSPFLTLLPHLTSPHKQTHTPPP